MIIGEWTQDTMREVKLDDQNRVFKINGFLDCGSRANTAAGTFLFECDNPMDMQFGADGAFYLLTYGNGFNVISPDAGMYKWEYVKGKRAAEGGADHRQDRRPVAADGQLLQRRLAGRGSGRLDPLRVELRRRLADLDRAQPDAHLHAARPLHGRADGVRLLG